MSHFPSGPKVLPLALVCLSLGTACTVTRDAPALAGQDVRLTIIHTSDIHSRLFPYNVVPNRFEMNDGLFPENAPFGGVARMATIAKAERANATRSLWLDSGDCFQGAPVFNMFKGQAELRALTSAGMDAAVIGNHEFDAGVANLVHQASREAGYPLLLANYEFEDPESADRLSLRDVVLPYQIFDVDGLKIGVIGMGNWSSMTGISNGGNSLGVRPRVDGEVVREYVRFLRPQVDLVVVLSHLGLDEDEGLGAHEIEVDENRVLPADGLDLILGGHLHIILSPPEVIHTDENGMNTYLTHPGAFAKFMLRHDIVVRVGEDNSNPTKRSHIKAITSHTIPVDSRVDDDPDVAEILLPFNQELNRRNDLDTPFAYVDFPERTKLQRNDRGGGDSQLGNMVARSMRDRTGVEADIAITNSLGIRADVERGLLTQRAMYLTFPFENSITVMQQLSGKEILATLDFVARRSAERGCKTQIQVDGITFDLVCNSRRHCPKGPGKCKDDEWLGERCRRNEKGDPDPNGAYRLATCADNVFVGDNCRLDERGNPDPGGDVRRTDLSGCQPLNPSGLYKVAVNDYIANGGSGFQVLEANPFKKNTGVSLRDSLINYLQSREACVEQINPATGEPLREEWGANFACLTPDMEAHDGRIRPVQ